MLLDREVDDENEGNKPQGEISNGVGFQRRFQPLPDSEIPSCHVRLHNGQHEPDKSKAHAQRE